MNKTIEHVIHVFIVKFIQENYHPGDITFSLIFGDKNMNKVYSRVLNHFNFLMTMATDSKNDGDYSVFI